MQQRLIKALILDMDGVLWRENEPIGDLPAIFNKLIDHGIRFVMATNNSTHTVEQYVEKVRSFKIPVEAWQIINSSLATVSLLKERFPDGGPVFVVGERALIDTLQSGGFHHVTDDNTPVLAVVAGMDRTLTYDKLKKATFLIRSGIPFIGSNPDRSFPTPLGLAPGAGAVLAAIQAATDVSPEIAGKPSIHMYKLALERLQTRKDETVVVGDRPETDILGGQRIGCLTALVLSGVVNRAQASVWQPAPTFITSDLSELVEILVC
jgi:4-nitrophenyl phosphatase